MESSSGDECQTKEMETIERLIVSIPQYDNPLRSPLPIEAPIDALTEDFVTQISTGSPLRSITQIFESTGKFLLYKYAALEDEDRKISRLCQLIDVIWILSRKDLGHVELRLVHEFLEDLFDIQTIDWCQTFWPFLEYRESRIASNLNGARRPGTDLIRICNALLKRLSKTQHSSFAGRILIFLGKAFPLSERSGVNQRGEFDIENTTQWDQDVDDKVYSYFWDLQKYFADPLALFTQQAERSKFQERLTLVLAELKKYSNVGVPSEKSSSSTSNTNSGNENGPVQMKDRSSISEGDEERYVPKWLTSKSLFELELNDTLFRRTIYSQIYFICDLIIGNMQQAEGIRNKSVQYAQIADPDFMKFISEVQDSLTKTQTSRTIDLDSAFIRSLKVVVARDKNWQNWKRQNTPSFEKPSLSSDALESASDTLAKQKGLKRPYQFMMGTPALSRLYKEATGLELLRNRKKFEIPEPTEYHAKVKKLKEVGEEGGDHADIDYELLSSVEWRGLRIARMHGLWGQFDKMNERSIDAIFREKE
ncbi:THO complex, subunit THOC1 [Myxozyma melibiosi]|uniref:THO complex, subunit THOC1 n=1 Tax=Myxozyma melibiosi TaxID=54550 RepID=A0ABR1F2X3_9ASCO